MTAPRLTWCNTKVWTCQQCAGAYQEAVNGRLRHLCYACGSRVVAESPEAWYSPSSREHMGRCYIGETVYGRMVFYTSTGVRPAEPDARSVGKLWKHHERANTGDNPTALYTFTEEQMATSRI